MKAQSRSLQQTCDQQSEEKQAAKCMLTYIFCLAIYKLPLQKRHKDATKPMTLILHLHESEFSTSDDEMRLDPWDKLKD